MVVTTIPSQPKNEIVNAFSGEQQTNGSDLMDPLTSKSIEKGQTLALEEHIYILEDGEGVTKKGGKKRIMETTSAKAGGTVAYACNASIRSSTSSSFKRTGEC
jgi:hypothetical protein